MDYYRPRLKSFSHQRPVDNYTVDFYAPSVGLVIEVDGIQHYDFDNQKYDAERYKFLKHLGLPV